MDLLTFIVEMTKALAWPLAALVISLAFRKQIQALIARVRKGKVGPAEFEFEQGVRELQAELPTALVNAPPVERAVSIALRASVDPRSVILESWLKTEAALEALGRKTPHFNALATPGTPYLANVLAKAGVIEPWLLTIYRELRRLRNQATHESDFSPSAESVEAYVRMADELQSEFKRLEDAL